MARRVLAALGAIASWRTAQDEGRLRERSSGSAVHATLVTNRAPGLAAD
jgi:hypothetical protein